MTVLTDKEIAGKLTNIMDISLGIRSTEYFILPDTTITVCTITLDCGFCVLGASICKEPEEFDEDFEQERARIDAFRKLEEPFRLLLSQKLFVDKSKD